MSSKRREFLKGIAAAGGLAALPGLAHSADGVTVLPGTRGKKTRDPVTGNAPGPEFVIDLKSGKLTPNPNQQVSFTMCLGCYTMCGVRVRTEKASGRVLRVAGNPYHPLSADPHLPYETPLAAAFTSLTRYGESGLSGRSTACGRGNAMLEQVTSPYRVLTPLKRVGPRNAGKWVPISFEQLLEEVVEGGNLFGEGHVDGLRAIHDLKTPLDPANPEYGPKANQLAVFNAVGDGRDGIIKRFTFDAFGTRNYGAHGSYCGLAMRVGSGAVMGDFAKNAHGKPDFSNCEFAIFIGSSPGNSGNPFKRQGRLVATARTAGKLEYVVIDPTLNNSSNAAVADRDRWIPITPGSDGAFAMAMIRWIIENQRYDAKFLSQPGPKAAEAAGEANWCNATHLVVVQEGHPQEGHFLRAADIGLAPAKDAAEALYVVIDGATGKPRSHLEPAAAALFYDGAVDTPNGPVKVKTSLQLLKEQAFRHTLDEYSGACGIPLETIQRLAREFTSHGKKAAVDAHGGMMASNGFYNAFAVLTLNTLIGNYNWKGGMSPGGGAFPSVAAGPRYNLVDFPGKVKPQGVFLCRSRFPYEKTSEFKRRKAAGENPYPAKAPWYPFSPPLLTEYFTSHFNGYPYKLKAIVSFMANPIYGHAGLKRAIHDKLKDPRELPLFVAVDAFINETSAYADYIVPDSVMYESWGWAKPWNGYLTKASTARWPVIEPAQAKTADGQSITMELFLIEVAKKLKLPGFGANAIAAADGSLHPLDRPEDFYLRAAANVAFAGKPVPDANDEEVALAGVTRIMPDVKKVLKPEEVRKVAYVYSRGGRFENASDAYQGERLKNGYKKPLCIYNETVGTARNSMTGRRYSGTASYMPTVFADGTPVEKVYPKSEWPFLLTPFKSSLQNSFSIGALRLRQVRPDNPVGINSADAARIGIHSGDKVRITTPGGSLVAVAQVLDGIAPGAVSIEHGYGHTELGARAHDIGGQPQPASGNGVGVNLNDLGLSDPRREGLSTLGDWAIGSAVRTALPARVEKV